MEFKSSGILVKPKDQEKVNFIELASSLSSDGISFWKSVHEKKEMLSQTLPFKKRVLIDAHKSIDSLEWIWACLANGDSYIPCDPSWPKIRRDYLINSSQCNLIVNENGELITHSKSQILIKESESYILFTSGTTGEPKGVVHSLRGLEAFVDWLIAEFNFSSKDKFVSVAPWFFDMSLLEAFVPPVLGADLFLADHLQMRRTDKLLLSIAEKKVSVLYCTPTLLRAFSELASILNFALPDLRLVLSAGESLYKSDIKNVKKFFPNAEVYNLYGPTETNVCTYYKVGDLKDEEVPIGHQVPYSTVKPTGKGDTFEIAVSGVSNAIGYLDKKGNLIEFDEWFGTGDYCKTNSRGELVFVGRRDNTIKRKGHRINLSEIEKHLIAMDQVKAVKVEFKDKKIVAHAEVTTTISNVKETIFEELRSKLPKYFMPDKIVLVDKLNQSETYKVTN